jgi:hypothetical protein
MPPPCAIERRAIPGGCARRVIRHSDICALFSWGARQRELNMRNLKIDELKAVSGGAAPKRNPAKAPGESYQGSADKNFGPK